MGRGSPTTWQRARKPDLRIRSHCLNGLAYRTRLGSLISAASSDAACADRRTADLTRPVNFVVCVASSLQLGRARWFSKRDALSAGLATPLAIISGVIRLVIDIATGQVVALHVIHVCLVEHRADKRVADIGCGIESVLNHINFGPP